MFEPITNANWPSQSLHLRDGFAGQLNVYRAMAHNPALLNAWENFRNYVVLQSSLGAERSEIVILRTGWRLNAPYEIAHHIVRGRKAGLSDARISALCTPQGPEAGIDALLARAVDELVADAKLTSPTLALLAEQLGKPGVLDVIATVGLYTTLAFIVKSFDTPVDTDIAAALAAQPLAAAP